MDKIYVNTIGLPIRLDCGRDISTAMFTRIDIRKPDGVILECGATIADTNYLEYTTVAGDLDLIGKYRIRSHLTLGAWTGSGETNEIQVYDDFE